MSQAVGSDWKNKLMDIRDAPELPVKGVLAQAQR